METNLIFAFILFMAGIVAGAVLGLFFYKDDFLGGYSSFKRRIVRLGHISFFGIGILNVLFYLSAKSLALSSSELYLSSSLFIIAGITMPLICFLSAYKSYFRHLFFIPVLSTFFAIYFFIKIIL